MDDVINEPETTNARTVRELQELIAALDRRLPQVRRVAETSIARAAGQLRAAAVRRIEELEENLRHTGFETTSRMNGEQSPRPGFCPGGDRFGQIEPRITMTGAVAMTRRAWFHTSPQSRQRQ